MGNKVTVEIGAQVSGLHAALSRGRVAFKTFAAGVKDDLAKIGSAAKSVAIGGVVASVAAATLAFGGLAAAVRTGLDDGGAAQDLAAQISDTRGNAVLMATAFNFAGLTAEDLAAALNRLQKDLKPEEFAKLGLNLEDLKRQAPTKALTEIGNAVAAIEDPYRRAELASGLFGKSYGKLLRVFGDGGGLELARKTLGMMPALLDRFGGGIDDLGDRTDALGKKWNAFSVGLVSQLTTIGPLLDQLLSVDTAKIGASLAKDISSAFSGKSVSAGIADLAGRFVRVMAAAAAAMSKVVAAALVNGFSGPISELGAQVEALVERINVGIQGSEGDKAMLTADRIQRLITSFQDQLSEVDARKPGSGHRSWLGIPDDYSPAIYEAKRAALLESIASAEKQRNALFDQAGKVGHELWDLSLESMEDRKSRLKTQVQDSSAKLIADAMAQIQQALAENAPRTGAAIKAEVAKVSAGMKKLFSGAPSVPQIDTAVKKERTANTENPESKAALEGSPTANALSGRAIIASALAKIGGGGGFAGGSTGLDRERNSLLRQIARNTTAKTESPTTSLRGPRARYA